MKLALLISEEGFTLFNFHLQKNKSIFEKMVKEFAREKLAKLDKMGQRRDHFKTCVEEAR
ncbi:hypothetical protein V7068_12525 [Bacillus sp. JJ634]